MQKFFTETPNGLGPSAVDSSFSSEIRPADFPRNRTKNSKRKKVTKQKCLSEELKLSVPTNPIFSATAAAHCSSLLSRYNKIKKRSEGYYPTQSFPFVSDPPYLKGYCMSSPFSSVLDVQADPLQAAREAVLTTQNDPSDAAVALAEAKPLISAVTPEVAPAAPIKQGNTAPLDTIAARKSLINKNIQDLISHQYKDYRADVVHADEPPTIEVAYMNISDPTENTHHSIRYTIEKLFNKTMHHARSDLKMFARVSEWSQERLLDFRYYSLPQEFVDLIDIRGVVLAIGVANAKVIVTVVVVYSNMIFTHHVSSLNLD